MKLISEKLENIAFGKSKDGYYYFSGPFIQAGIVNGNNRIYNYSKVVTGINTYITEKVLTHRALGELNHPLTPEINPKEASHLIVDLKEQIVDRNKGICNWIGKAKVLNPPNGKIVQALLEDGVQLGVSTRALGTLKELNGINEVQSDFKLCTAADIVYEPSAPEAFIQAILEKKEWIIDGQGQYRELFINEYKKQIKKQTYNETKESLLNTFRKFLTIL